MALKTTVLSVLWIVVVFVATEATNSTTLPTSSNSTTLPTSSNSTAVPTSSNSTAVPTSSNSTAVPTSQTSTAAPTSQNSTAVPTPSNSTAVPTPSNSTVELPPSNSTVELPPSNSTLEPTPSNSTLEPTPSNSTVPVGNSTVDPPTTQPPDPCDQNPCGDGSRCEARVNLTHVCLCRSGDAYNDDTSSCVRARVFPGRVQTNESYSDELATKTSPEFAQVSQRIIDDMRIRLRNFVNVDVMVFELLPSAPVSRTQDQTVTAVVQIIFPANSDVTSETLTGALAAPCDNCTLTESFTPASLCDFNACDAISSTCTDTDGIVACLCRPGYTPVTFVDRVCLAACPNGQQTTDTGCVDCPFGYTGFNCEENWQLYLVITGCVLGGLLLISFIIFAIYVTKYPKKRSRRRATFM